ncbi:hypothetical protein HYPSUDRAFT_87066 [Hypholoma sublateritium FD-334 SS-4]|uniref:Uncharacterized protein n=1 Tax=Hypholoma sublateritium (strain FD-334 SS-4) TaxID=945553 RepID=A0A0D2NVR8_HYPSF|nr:hypothetical protein HYPSUDRAFT_87066 [Hypholoma sublateritium FD-334 SS-4]
MASVCAADRNQSSTALAPALKLVPLTLKTALGDSQRHSSVLPRKEIQYPYTESSQQLSIDIWTPSRKPPTARGSPVMTSPISSNTLSPIALSANEAITSPVQLYELSDEHRQPSTVRSPPFSQLGTTNGGPEDDTRLSTPASTKRLRTLGSFMDEFLDTIRSVNAQTPAEATQADKYPRRSKTTRRSSQTRTARIDNNNDSEGTSAILRGRRLTVTQPSQLPSEAETRPSNSPDLFALLEQENYRITLVST